MNGVVLMSTSTCVRLTFFKSRIGRNAVTNNVPIGVEAVAYLCSYMDSYDLEFVFGLKMLCSMRLPIGIPIPIPPTIESHTSPLTIATSESTIAIFISNLVFASCKLIIIKKN